jgi:hypothetical protein
MDGKYSEYLQGLEASLPAPRVPAVAGKYGTLLQELDAQLGMTPVPEALRQPEERPAVEYSQMNYSENDLLQDDFFIPIQEYMVDRFGTHIQDMDKEEVVTKFTNNLRGFSGGNSVRAINEITYLNEVGEDEDRLAKAGRAYEIFEGLQPIFGGDTTWGETLSGTLDYARSAVLDPANVLGLGVGKVASGVGFKAGSQATLIAAKHAYKKQLAKGATQEAAQKVAERVLRMQTSRVVTETNKQIATRQAAEKAATTFLQRMSTPTAVKEAAIVGGFEAAMAAGTDYLYQDAMLRTKVQEEYNVYQTGLSAVVGLVAGGLSGALSNVRTGASGLLPPEALKTSTKGSTSLSKLTAQATTTPSQAPYVPGASNWLKDVAKGKELADQDTEFFTTMLLGNDEKGLKGLAQILVEDGYVWKRRTPDDKVSNWVGDIIKYADPQDAKQFLDDFSKTTGIEMVEGKQLTIEAFADTFKKKMSDSGKVLNAASQVAKVLGRDPKSITVEDYAKFVLGGGATTPQTVVGAGANKIGKAVGDFIGRDLPDFQNNIIRLMVSNLSTTALNVTGYAAATGLNTATDVTRAVLLGGKAGIYMAIKPKEAKAMGIEAFSLLQNQVTKAKNTLDPNATYETFLQYAQVRPEALRQLTAVLPGGIESLDKLAKGFDPSTPLLTLQSNQAVDIIQRLSLVSAQDGYTKAIEFTSQLDKLLRRSPEKGGFGMSWNEFFAAPDHHSKMVSERYALLEAQAVDETLRSVFSKSFKGKGFLGEVAGMIEDARNLPGIGLLVPFGRFFNNTVAFAYQTTGFGPLIAKSVGLGDQSKPMSELVSRGLVSWSLIGMLAQREMDYIDQGLGWSEEIDEATGEVIDERYEFPYGAYKAVARLFAHHARGEAPPEELLMQMGDQFFGQLTRQLGEAGAGLNNIATAALSDEGPGLGKTLLDALGSIVPQAISAATRPLEPLNVLAGLARDEEFYVPDRKQGTAWVNNSLRYMDQAIALITGENLAPPKQSAAEGQPTVQASKLVSTTRGSRLTNTERVMNEIGRPTYLASMASQSEAADNRYNEIFNEIVEDQAGVLFRSKRFREGTLEVKQGEVTKLLSEARKATLGYMGRVASNGGDRALMKMINISRSYPKLKVQRTLEDLGFDRGVDKLSEDELDTLENALKFREEFINKQ